MNKKLTIEFKFGGQEYQLVGLFTANMKYPLEVEGNETTGVPEPKDEWCESITFVNGYEFEVLFRYDRNYNVNYERPYKILVKKLVSGKLIGEVMGYDAVAKMSGTLQKVRKINKIK